MIKNITRLILITLFAYFVFDYSVAIDVEQFYKDLKRFNLNMDPNLNQTYIFISFKGYCFYHIVFYIHIQTVC